MASDDIHTVDRASLERFQSELIAAGFEPVPGAVGLWQGPIAEPFRELTAAQTMLIEIRHGWPFRHPRLLVEGMRLDHVNASGEVCLWREGDQSMQWASWDGFLVRIVEWCLRQESGFGEAGALLDAHLSYEHRRPGLAILRFPLDDWTADRRDPLKATRGLFGSLDIHPGEASASETIGRRYDLMRAPELVFETLGEVHDALTKGQATNFEKLVGKVEAGAEFLVVLVWPQHGTHNALCLHLALGDGGDVLVRGMEAAPADRAALQARSGPDVSVLKGKKVLLIGAGAIGSHVAMALAASGLGRLVIVDPDKLRPGNVTRFVTSSGVGAPKAFVLKVHLGSHAPWTEVDARDHHVWDPELLRSLISDDVDIAVDTTGFGSMATQLDIIASDVGVPMVTSALYRAGAVARVRRHVSDRDTPLLGRVDEARFPLIPPGEERESLEVGCTAPVNNAPPSAVMAIAARTAQVVIDCLAGRFEYPEEVFEVYCALPDEPPFNEVGQVAER